MHDEWAALKSLVATLSVALFVADCYLVVHTVTSDEFLTPIWVYIFSFSLLLQSLVKSYLWLAKARLDRVAKVHTNLEDLINEDAMGITIQENGVIKAATWVLNYWRGQKLPYKVAGVNITSRMLDNANATLNAIIAYLAVAVVIQVTRVFGDDVTISRAIKTLFEYWLFTS